MAKPAFRNSGRSGGSSIFTGVLIGLIVGAVLAVGVALWVTGNNPFKSATPASAPSQAAPATPETAPSFDFYKVLPSDAPSELPPSAAPAPLYYLQAGAFQNADDADNLKAQLAMLGVEAVIQTGEVADKGVFHRVRVGPFRALDEVNRTRSLLTQNDIPATLVKELPTLQETP
ncbi:MAG: SPOR domain-containing protein [Thiobacillus sp.]|nr:SPOR domain-containing protein [Thiobacillus sp.]MDP2058058.1 SPOR domain-containing protein [Thiobacillus sp.]